MERYDIVIIGGGPGGYAVAAEAAAKGSSVVLIERDKPGGTCLNRGCIPTKCLCATASVALELRKASEFGIVASMERIDFDRAKQRMRAVVEELRGGVEALLGKVRLVRAEGRITPDGNVAAGEEIFSAGRILIATGSRPAIPDITGAELAITSDDILQGDLPLPKHLVIIGGGVIGIEFASIFNALGCDVTVLEYCREILPQFDSDIAKRLRLALQSRGVRFATGASVQSIEPGLKVAYTTKRGENIVDADQVLLATGRKPVLPSGLAEAGIELDERGFIAVDEGMQTSRPGIYAAGDVTGICMLAHAAEAQARIALSTDDSGSIPDTTIIPSAVFSTPEAAMVGLTAEDCGRHGIECATARCNYGGNGKALADGVASTGLVKIVYSPTTRLILGVHVLGAHASDIVAEGAALMYGMTSIDELAEEIVHSHPTLSELLVTAARSATI